MYRVLGPSYFGMLSGDAIMGGGGGGGFICWFSSLLGLLSR